MAVAPGFSPPSFGFGFDFDFPATAALGSGLVINLLVGVGYG